MQKVSDLFKAPGQVRAKVQYKEDYTRGNVWAKNGIQASNTHRQEEEKPLKTLMTSGITNAKVINPTNQISVDINVSASNIVEKIEVSYDLSIRYEDATKVEEITNTKGYESYINEGYKLYNIYKYNPYANRDLVYCVLGVK